MYDMAETVVTDQRQMTLPREVTEAAGLKPGDQVQWRFEAGELRGRKLDKGQPITFGLGDVPAGSILHDGWQVDSAEIAKAVREERDDP